MVAPGYASAFTHSAKVVNLMERQNYRWVQRGEPIAEFRINGSYGEGLLARMTSTKDYTALIRSPASGLLLHTDLDHALNHDSKEWNARTDPPTAAFALLLPDDEQQPESGKYMFDAMCRLARDMRHYYLKDSRYWSMTALEPEAFEELMVIQCSANPLIFDALPNWADYLDEARTQKPELRPKLKHLVVR